MSRAWSFCLALLSSLVPGLAAAQPLPVQGAVESGAVESLESVLSGSELPPELAPSAPASFEDTLTFRSGTVTLGDDLATVELGEDLRYLGPEDTDRLLQQWGNLPDPNTLGMLVPTGQGLFEPDTWVVLLTYTEEGHVSDEDADEIDYDEILVELQSDTAVANAERRSRGLAELDLLAWAEPPHYDPERRQLYWAQHLLVQPSGKAPTRHEVNYSIRMLGRRGVLELNALAAMDNLPAVRANMAELFPRVQFSRGQRYADFDPSVDEVAAYGLGALVLGKVLSKAGVLAVIGAALAKGWKLILVLFGVLAAFARRLFGRKPDPSEPPRERRRPIVLDQAARCGPPFIS